MAQRTNIQCIYMSRDITAQASSGRRLSVSPIRYGSILPWAAVIPTIPCPSPPPPEEDAGQTESDGTEDDDAAVDDSAAELVVSADEGISRGKGKHGLASKKGPSRVGIAALKRNALDVIDPSIDYAQSSPLSLVSQRTTTTPGPLPGFEIADDNVMKWFVSIVMEFLLCRALLTLITMQIKEPLAPGPNASQRFTCRACQKLITGSKNLKSHRDGYLDRHNTMQHKVCPKRAWYSKKHQISLPPPPPETQRIKLAAARSNPFATSSLIATINPSAVNFRKSVLNKLATIMTIQMHLPWTHIEHPAFKALIRYCNSAGELGSDTLMKRQVERLHTLLRAGSLDHFKVGSPLAMLLSQITDTG